MPKAVAVSTDTQKFDLKSLPEGFVELRRLSYGEKVQRQGMSNLEMQGSGKKNVKMLLQMANEQATIFDFVHCLVDHNLEDEAGQKLDLTAPLNIRRLDPRVGEEISQLMDKLNNFEEEDDELGN